MCSNNLQRCLPTNCLSNSNINRGSIPRQLHQLGAFVMLHYTNDYPVDTYLPLRSRMALTNYSSKLSAALRWRSWWSSEDVTTGKVDDRWKQECMISHRRWRDVPRKIVLIELRCSANRILIPTGTGRYGIKWHTSLWARRDDQCGMQIKCKFYMVLRWIMICE